MKVHQVTQNGKTLLCSRKFNDDSKGFASWMTIYVTCLSCIKIRSGETSFT